MRAHSPVFPALRGNGFHSFTACQLTATLASMVHEESSRRPVSISVPSRKDPLLKLLTEVVGGPLGKHAAPGVVHAGPFTVDRVLVLLTTVAAVLAVLLRNPCRTDGWVTPVQFYRGCYSDWTEAFQFQGIGKGVFPGLDPASTFDGPPLLGFFAGLVALPIPVPESQIVEVASVVRYFDVNAALMALAWMITVVATVRLASRRPWDAALVAVAPIAILVMPSGWAFIAVALGTLGMLFFARGRWALAGMVFAIGAGFSAHVLLIYGAILLLAARTGRWRPALLTGAGIAGVGPLLLVFLGSWPGISWEYDPARIEVSSSVWAAYNVLAERVGAPVLSTEAVMVTAVVVFVAFVVLVALLVSKAPRRPRLPQVGFLLIGALVLVLPDYRPEFVLWLLPLLALTYVDWRIILVWQVGEVLHWWAYWMSIAREASAGAVANNIDSPYFAAAILLRLALTGYLLYRVADQVLEPAFDPVRRLGIDDPAGGPFDGAPDRPTMAPVGWSESASGPEEPAPKDHT